jgi:hypothetical protein
MKDTYTVKTKHDENSMHAMAEIQNNIYAGIRKRVLTILGYVLTAAGGVLFVMLRQSAIAFLPVIIGCWLLGSQGTLAKARAKQMIKSIEGRDPWVEYQFDPEGFHIKNAIRQGRTGYDSIVNAAENPEYFFLFINTTTAHVLRKTDFLLGDPASFAAFIENRTGLNMQFYQRKSKAIFARR